jgi:hypothetical protein
MEKPSLRAIVLDNDETTGSYMIVFSFLNALQKDRSHFKYSELAELFKKLAFWMFKNNVFRPGIRRLLSKIKTLKKTNSIDAVIMYTNQINGNVEISYEDEEGSFHDFINMPAKTIAYMMECLVGENVFDDIITRSPDQICEEDGIYPKSFRRILDLYPNYANDITNIIFIDDYACPRFIRADDIEKVHHDSWYCISPYMRRLSEVDIRNCIEYCYSDPIDREFMFYKVYKHYRHNMPKQRDDSAPCEVTIHELCDILDYKFIYQDIFNKIFDERETDKNHLKILSLLEDNG